MLSSLIQASTILLLFHFITTTFLEWRKLRHFPGAPLAGFSRIWLFMAAITGQAYQFRMALRKKHGASSPLLRVGPDMLITDDPSIFKRVNSAHGGYVRGDWYRVFSIDPHHDTLIASVDNKFHDDVRAKVAGGLTGRDVPRMEAVIDEVVGTLVRMIEGKYVSAKGCDKNTARSMDWSMIAQFFTLDALTRVGYLQDFGHLEKDDDVVGHIKTVEDMGTFLAVCSDVPWLGTIMSNKLFLRLWGPKPTDPKGPGAVMGVCQRVVRERFANDPNGTENQDMLSSFIRHGLPQQQCEAELPSQFVAGSDTTANALRVGVLMAATIPRVLAALRKDIDDAAEAGRLSSPITTAEAKQLPYLQGFIWEILRLNPPAALLLPKVVPPKGDTFDGKFVPGGTKIGVDFWSMCRRPEIFGDDADVFRPERWVEASPEERDKLERTTELIFGWGRYSCLGKNMAWIEMEKVFVELFRRFDFQLINPITPFVRQHYALFKIRDMHMTVTKRAE
ncbi:Pisatin demethylase [Naviculisporaceae sp. PSN 640]